MIVMKVQKTGPDSVLVVLDAAELGDGQDLRSRAFEALEREGIPAVGEPELTAYTAGSETVLFVCAAAREDTYFGFDSADDLLDAASEAQRLFPEAGARLCRADDRLYLATSCRRAAELLREYAAEIVENGDFTEESETIIAHGAFQILSGRCCNG